MSAYRLASIIGDVTDFRSKLWQRAPAVLRPEAAFEPPLTLAGLDDVLAYGALQSVYVEVTRSDVTIAPEAYCSPRTVTRTVHHGFADGAKIGDLVRDGGTLALRSADQWHAPTAALTSALSSELGRKVDAVYFVTPPGHQGLRIHRDDADVFVVQLNGSKSWRVHAGPTDDYWRPGITEDDGPPLLSETLRAGEVLYIPRGFAHYATGAGGLSVHLSLAVREVGGNHLYGALQQALLEGYRTESRPIDDDSLLARAADMLAHLADRLPTLSPHDVVALARAAMLADVRHHTSPGLNDLAVALNEPVAGRAPTEAV